MDECRVDVFDVRNCSMNTLFVMLTPFFQATLINEGLVDMVAPHRLLFPDAPNSVKMLGKPTSRAEYAPWSFVQILELVVYLPLNFIPVVGAPAYIIITGARLGKLSFHRWYKLRGLHRRERKKEAQKYSWDFVWFGTIAMILELVPLLAFFFLLTTATGCALWVSKLEKKARGWTTVDRQARAEEGQAGDSVQAGPQEASARAGVTAPGEEEPPPPYSDDIL